MYYPIVLKVKDRRVVVIGGGEVAEAKVQTLLESGADVKVISPEATSWLRELAEAGKIMWIARTYDSSDLENAFFVVAATDDPAVQDRIWRDARQRNVLINSVDDPDRCDFIMPSVLRRDDLIVAVSTSGKSPAFAAWLQRQLAGIVTKEFGRAVSLLGSMRSEFQQRFKNLEERKRAYQRIFATNIVKWIADCDDETAKSRVHELIENL